MRTLTLLFVFMAISAITVFAKNQSEVKYDTLCQTSGNNITVAFITSSTRKIFLKNETGENFSVEEMKTLVRGDEVTKTNYNTYNWGRLINFWPPKVTIFYPNKTFGVRMATIQLMKNDHTETYSELLSLFVLFLVFGVPLIALIIIPLKHESTLKNFVIFYVVVIITNVAALYPGLNSDTLLPPIFLGFVLGASISCFFDSLLMALISLGATEISFASSLNLINKGGQNVGWAWSYIYFLGCAVMLSFFLLIAKRFLIAHKARPRASKALAA